MAELMNSERNNESIYQTLLRIILIAGIPFLLCYLGFIAFHEQITHINRPSDEMIRTLVDPHSAPEMRNEHDGIEKNVLFLIFLIVGPAGYLLYRSRISSKVLMGVGFILGLVFLKEVHFIGNILFQLFHNHQFVNSAKIFATFIFGVGFFRWLFYKNNVAGYLAFVGILILICFCPIGKISYSDYAYVLAPALKVIQSGKLTAAYFQYDFLPSIPAWFVLKLGGGTNDFRLVIQAGMFFFMIAVFAIGRKIFVHKNLAVYLFMLLVLVRFFMNESDITTTPQVTAIRLDWWLLLVAICFKWGLSDIKLGLSLLLLMVLHNGFGEIYFTIFFITTVFLLCFQIYDNHVNGRGLLFLNTLYEWVKMYAPNFFLALAGIFTYWLVTGKVVSESLLLYQRFQLGMLPMQQDSAYWYFGAIFTFCFVLLLLFKDEFNKRYWQTSVFVMFLFVGNSIYFFGRSHENNIINISGILLFVVVLTSDILLQLFSKQGIMKPGEKAIALAPVYFILFVLTVEHACNFGWDTRDYLASLRVEIHNMRRGHFRVKDDIPSDFDLATIANLTHGNRQIYFMTYGRNIDFYLYYRGHYEMPTKFVPIESWLLTSEKIDFANNKLNSGYYVIASDTDAIFKNQFLPKLNFKKREAGYGYMAISN